MVKIPAFILCFSILLFGSTCQPDLSQDIQLSSLPLLDINISPGHMVLLKRKRHEALRDGVLVTKKKDYVPALLRYKGQDISATLRLKGDWLDHLKGGKWSFRIKLDSTATILGMQRFSIQHPRTRSYLDEWVFHKLLEQENILTPHYTFVQIRLNGKYKGIYALEEHFDKLLLEKQKRREAPILKYTEDGFWQAQQYRLAHGSNLTPYIPHFEAAEIEAFQKGRTLGDSMLRQNYLYAQQKLEDFRMTKELPANLVDLESMARLFALADIAQAYHSLRWHNLRFYYNPFTTKLEPVVYDAYGANGPYRWFSKPYLGFYNERYSKAYFREEYIIFNLFNQPSFRKLYLHYHQQFSDPVYLETFFKKHTSQIRKLEIALQKEFSSYQYDWQFLKRNAADLSAHLSDYQINHAPFQYSIYSPNYDSCRAVYPLKAVSLKASVIKESDNNLLLSLSNYYCQEITIKATGPKKTKPIHLLSKAIHLPAFDIHHQPPATTSLSIPKGDRYIFYTVPGRSFWYRNKISAWPRDTVSSIFNLDELSIDSSVFRLEGDTLYLFKGKHQLNHQQIIPKGTPLVVEAGAEVDLIDGGGLLLQGSLIMRGQKDLPIRIFSSDGRSTGWQIIEASGKAKLAWVNFENLQPLRKNGHWLSGGVTIYNTDIIMHHCHFSDFDSDDALNIVSCKKGLLKDLTFRQCRGDALDVDFSSLNIDNCRFRQIDGDALDCSGSDITVHDLDIQFVKDKGISLGEACLGKLYDISVKNTNIGLAVKDATQARVNNLILEKCNYGVTVFNKKNYFHTAKLILDTLQCFDTDNCLSIELGQEVSLNGQTQEATDSIGYLPGLLY